ncbi:hypothetical protein HAP93_11710 [Acidithiobacillus ferriphilus]|nr:hypothetical protein [Acidithiobacillus ferriphilus]
MAGSIVPSVVTAAHACIALVSRAAGHPPPQAGQGQAQSTSSGSTHDISCKKYLCHHELIL